MTTVDAEANPTLANELIAKATAPRPAPGSGEPPVAAPPPDSSVTLPGGFLNPLTGKVSTTAEVRELTGVDEEALAKAGSNLSKLIDTILARGVVSIGDDPADKRTLDTLLAGDREALILGVRIVTFGDELEPINVKCPECGTEQEVALTCSADIPTKTLEDPINDRVFVLDLPSGKKATVRLPDGEAQKAIASSTDTNYGVLNTLLLSKTVTAINGMPVFSEDQVRALSIRDRDKIIKTLGERNCGPRLREVSRPCEQCNAVIPLPLSLADLFRF